LSREYPEWVGSAYNDTFEVHLTSDAWSGQIVFDSFGSPMTVNNAFFTVVAPASLAGTGFDADGGTGWLTVVAPCVGGETIHLSFEIYDVADGVWDSAVLLDGFEFSADPAPDGGPWTGGDDDDDVTDDDATDGDDDDDPTGDDDDATDDDDDDATDDDDGCGSSRRSGCRGNGCSLDAGGVRAGLPAALAASFGLTMIGLLGRRRRLPTPHGYGPAPGPDQEPQLPR
jgi:hypothetical protein